MRCFEEEHFASVGMRLFCQVLKITSGTVDSCVETSKRLPFLSYLTHENRRNHRGELPCVSPGGLRENIFSDPVHYDLIWKERFGLAKVALEAKVVSAIFFGRVDEACIYTVNRPHVH